MAPNLGWRQRKPLNFIQVDENNDPVAISEGGGDASAANQVLQTTELEGINTKLTTLLTHTDGLETKLDTINTSISDASLQSDVISVVLSLDTSAYQSGDVLSATQEIANSVRANGGRGVLQSLTVRDIDDQGVGFDIVFFDENTSLGTENNAPDIDDTEALTMLGWVPVTAADYIDLGGCRVATVRNLNFMFEAAGGTRSIWFATITRGAPTYTASGLEIDFAIAWL